MAAYFFPQTEAIRKAYGWYSPVQFGEHFYGFMDRQVVSIIKKETGLSPSPQFTIALGFPDSSRPTYIPGATSRLNFIITVSNGISRDIAFCWKSRSGKIVKIDEEGFDENDLECWMEGLTPEKYYEDFAMISNKRPPFKMKNLPFELEIRDYAYTMHVYVTLTEQGLFDIINADLNGIIVKFNDLAYARDTGQDKGPALLGVHNWKITLEEDGRILVYIDAASPEILKKLMKGLAKHKQVSKVEMDLVS